jgi:hypothetical protein
MFEYVTMQTVSILRLQIKDSQWPLSWLKQTNEEPWMHLILNDTFTRIFQNTSRTSATRYVHKIRKNPKPRMRLDLILNLVSI